MSLFAVRHAAAGERHLWSGPDEDRPIDQRGRDQADALAAELATRSVGRLLSSPAVRCTQTLGPMAARLGLEIEEVPELSEGADGDDAAALARRLVTEDAVLCSHGDVIPALIRSLALDGMTIIGSRGCEKGSVWELEVSGTDIVTARYLGVPPPARERIDD